MGYQELLNAGLTNASTDHIGNLMGVGTKRPHAYCSSHFCCRIVDSKGRVQNRSKIEKIGLGASRSECPDCGHALLIKWRWVSPPASAGSEDV
jgi:DNA-directed RNA polymerase subunit RPC12/RpoP